MSTLSRRLSPPRVRSSRVFTPGGFILEPRIALDGAAGAAAGGAAGELATPVSPYSGVGAIIGGVVGLTNPDGSPIYPTTAPGYIPIRPVPPPSIVPLTPLDLPGSSPNSGTHQSPDPSMA